jgi:Flp pilus assembly protein TadD
MFFTPCFFVGTNATLVRSVMRDTSEAPDVIEQPTMEAADQNLTLSPTRTDWNSKRSVR